jgi:hypothetical protein
MDLDWASWAIALPREGNGAPLSGEIKPLGQVVRDGGRGEMTNRRIRALPHPRRRPPGYDLRGNDRVDLAS